MAGSTSRLRPAMRCLLSLCRKSPRGEMTSKVSLIAVLISAVGSFTLLLRAGQRTPRLLLVVMAIWVLAPFAALVLATVLSKRWSDLTRATLRGVMWIVALGALAIYA